MATRMPRSSQGIGAWLDSPAAPDVVDPRQRFSPHDTPNAKCPCRSRISHHDAQRVGANCWWKNTREREWEPRLSEPLRTLILNNVSGTTHSVVSSLLYAAIGGGYFTPSLLLIFS
jgi:hypothetical protein